MLPDVEPVTVDQILGSDIGKPTSKKRKRTAMSDDDSSGVKVRKKRGPKPGFKRPAHWAKPGRKP